MTNLLEKKMELETLYNQLLMQHESLPSEIHKEWNQKAMDCIDEGLTKIEKELTIEFDFSSHGEVEKAETVKENKISKAEKAHYVQSNLKGFENYFKTKIYSVEYYKNHNENELIINSRVNVNQDYYERDFVEIETVYNINTGKMKSKAVSSCKRKDIAPAKKQIEEIILHHLKSNDMHTVDYRESRDMTSAYYYNLLKTNGYGVNVTNELDNLVNHKMLSVKDIADWVTEKLEKQSL